eukprot:10059_1
MQCDKFFEFASTKIGDAELDDVDATFQFEIEGRDGKISKWAIDTANKKIVRGGVDEPTCTFQMSDDNFVKLMKKEAEAAELFMTKKLKLDGDMGEAMKFQSVMEGMGEGINIDEIFPKSKL